MPRPRALTASPEPSLAAHRRLGLACAAVLHARAVAGAPAACDNRSGVKRTRATPSPCCPRALLAVPTSEEPDGRRGGGAGSLC
eukprot:1618466-Prymnesium_polylepis.1